MRVLLCNYRYFVSGGPERYMFNVQRRLEDAGHQVVPFSVRYARNRDSAWSEYFVPPIAGEDQARFDEHRSDLASTWRGLERLFYSREVYDAVCRLIDASKPDVAYVLHYLRKLSPAVLAACADKGVPVVVRPSDYQIVCPAATMMCLGRECELCVRGSLFNSVWHKCVKGSYSLSALNAAALGFQRWKRYFDAIDAFVCPTQLMRQTLESSGVVSCPVYHLPTLVEPQSEAPLSFRERDLDVVYVGRLDPDKGVETLLAAHEAACAAGDGFGLTIIGDYVGHDRLRALALPDVVFTGFLPYEQSTRLLARAKVCVIPSVWPENLPNSLLEAWSCGTPVVASRIGSLQDTVCAAGGGRLATPANAMSLSGAIAGLLSDCGEWTSASTSGYKASSTVYSPEAHLARLLTILEQAIHGATVGERSRTTRQGVVR